MSHPPQVLKCEWFQRIEAARSPKKKTGALENQRPGEGFYFFSQFGLFKHSKL